MLPYRDGQRTSVRLATKAGIELNTIELIEKSEHGDAAAALALAQHFADEQEDQANQIALLFLERSCFLRAARLEGANLDPATPAALEHMRDTVQANPSVGDCVIPAAICLQCNLDHEEAICIFVGTGQYTTLEELIGHALRVSEIVQHQYLPACSKCRCNLSVIHADYFSRSFDDSQWLVVRCFPKQQDPFPDCYALMWFDPETGNSAFPATVPDEAERCTSALERAAKLRLAGKIDACAAVVQEAFMKWPQDPCFIHMVPLIQSKMHLALCQNLARAHISSYPSDPLGYFCLAESLLRGFLGNPKAVTALEQAVLNIDKALSLRADWKEAELLQCMIASFIKSAEAETERRYRKLLAKYPDYANALFEYGLSILKVDCARAALMFKRALAASPEEAAYAQALSHARSLMQAAAESQ